MTSHPFLSRRSLALAGFLLLAAAAAPALDASVQAPRRPPEPFTVFVHASDPEDPELKEGLDKAVEEIRDRVAGRRHWFRVVDDLEDASLTLRVINYRTSQTMLPKLERLVINGRVELVERSEIVEFHYVDAVALGGGARQNLTGLDERDTGPSLRNAASDLAEQLEEFCKDNYAALTSQ